MRPATRILIVAGCSSLLFVNGCAPDVPAVAAPDLQASAVNRASYPEPGMHRQYGTPIRLGKGMIRTYVVLDAKAGQTAVEMGVAIDESVLKTLPYDGEGHSMLLQLPAKGPAPYQFVEVDWNPNGHEPPGVYDTPHFDFHFYLISQAEWNTIVPSNPNWAAYATNVPTGNFVPPGYVLPGPPDLVAVPKMGVHWLSLTAPELQNLFGHPELWAPFSRTFIYGSWNGRITFLEPMITLQYLLSQPIDAVSPISTPLAVPQPGMYPLGYRVTYDAQAKEYRVALTDLVNRS